MIRRVDVLVAVPIVLVVGGLVVVLVVLLREIQAHELCRDNLRGIGLGLVRCQENQGHFPAGTVPNAALAPEERLSWYVGAWNYCGDMTELLLDREAGWEADANREVRRRYRLAIDPHEANGDPTFLTCPGWVRNQLLMEWPFEPKFCS